MGKSNKIHSLKDLRTEKDLLRIEMGYMENILSVKYNNAKDTIKTPKKWSMILENIPLMQKVGTGLVLAYKVSKYIKKR